MEHRTPHHAMFGHKLPMPTVSKTGLPDMPHMAGLVEVKGSHYKMPNVDGIVSAPKPKAIAVPTEKVKPSATKMPIGMVQLELH